MRYKIDDIVKVKDLNWYNKNKDSNGYVNSFTEDMAEYCGSKATIVAIDNEYKRYKLDIDDWAWWWSEDMFEEIVGDGIFFDTEYEWKHEFRCPDGYQLVDEKGNVINATKIVLEKKKKEYPNTYGECCELLGKTKAYQSVSGYKTELLEDFQKLLICRDAYWKIAGEKMGLGKPWEPNWVSDEEKYMILFFADCLDFANWAIGESHLLAFPTEEIRYAFYENFKELIEQCKELL